jgi:hypothetical protein
MKCIPFIFCCVVFFSCKKDNSFIKFPQGVYVEETLRLDTMDFTINDVVLDGTVPQFNFRQGIDTAIIPRPVPGFNNRTYQFEIKANTTIDLRSMLSSNSNYVNYYFSWQTGATSFEIDKFYIRSNLPNRLRFVKI